MQGMRNAAQTVLEAPEAVCHKSANDLLTKADLALNDFFIHGMTIGSVKG